MTNRRRMKLVSLACMALLAGCGGGEEEQQSEQASDDIVVDLEAQGDYDASGLRATLEAEGALWTRVLVDGLDEGEPTGAAPTPPISTVGHARNQTTRGHTRSGS